MKSVIGSRTKVTLTATTAMALLAGYARRAYAACSPNPAPTYSCSGSNTTAQSITSNNANVSTVPGFGVHANAGTALSITGAGAVSFTDSNSSTIATTDISGYGLRVSSTGNVGGTPGSVSITLNGSTISGGANTPGILAETAPGASGPLTIDTGIGSVITGGQEAILVQGLGTGPVSIDVGANSKLYGTTATGPTAGGFGIFAQTPGSGMTITTAGGSYIHGTNGGIQSIFYGAGQSSLKISGTIRADAGAGIGAYNSSLGVNSGAQSALSITSYAGSNISAGGTGIVGENFGGSQSITINGDVLSQSGDGIEALNFGSSNPYGAPSTATDLTVTVGSTNPAATVTGALDGIYAANAGTGSTTISVGGDVTSANDTGINAINGVTAANLSVTTTAGSSVSGAYRGISALNNGTGATTISVDGDVTSSGVNAIVATNSTNGTSLTITTGASSNISAGNSGETSQVTAIYGVNRGAGPLSITIGGAVTATTSDGVYNLAVAGKNYGGGNMTVVTDVGSVIKGDGGIIARNYNSGSLTVTANGDVDGSYAGNGGTGIWATNHATSPASDLTITTGANTVVTGGNGIVAQNFGSGALLISINGDVTGVKSGGSYGIAATNSGTSLTINTAAGTSVTGDTGIFAGNYGTGALSITVNGDVTGTSNDGIYAVNTSNDPTITTAAGTTVKGGANGIAAANSGAAALNITANGTVTGTSGHGISAAATGSGAIAVGVGATGLVQGGTDGVYASSASSSIGITNAGTIQNLSGLSTALAIASVGGPTSISNAGLVTGTVNLGNQGSSFTNTGTWDTAGGTNNFGTDTADNSVDNEAGATIVAAARGATDAVTTTFDGLGTFDNAGLIDMHNGVAGDRTVITGNYVGQGGTVAIDTYLGTDGSASDRLVLNGGTATGNSFLAVSNTTGPGLKTVGNGIEVIEADSGATTVPNAFQLAGPVASGAYQYFLFRGGPSATGSAGDGGDVAQNWYLRSDLIATTPPPPPVSPPPVSPPPAAPTFPNYRPEVPVYLAMSEMASEMGFATIDNLQAREGDEFEDPIPTLTPVQTTQCKNPDINYRCPLPNTKSPQEQDADLVQRYGMWSRLLAFTGAQLPGDRSLSANNTFLRGEGPSYTYTLGGFQTGMTFLRRDGSDGARDRAGFYIGDTQMWGDVQQVYSGVYATGRAGNVDLNGVNVGGYWTHYGATGWYSDSVVQGTWYDRAQGYGDLSSMDVGGFGFAASEELGDPFQLSHGWVLEPQVQAIYEHVHLDSGYDAYGYTSFGATDDLRARIGARLVNATSITTGSGAIIPLSVWGRFNVWHDFLLNRPAATFSGLSLIDPTTLTGALEGTWGELDAGATAQITRTISLFGSAVYDHSIDGAKSWAAGGRLGVKVAW
jgi:outer membrane autotransporter protein